jgi:hypothetical protein
VIEKTGNLKNLLEATKVFTTSLKYLPEAVVTGQGLATNGFRQGRANVEAETANVRDQWSLASELRDLLLQNRWAK